MIVTEGPKAVSVTLTNGLPTAAGNTSILFPGFIVTSPTGSGVPGPASAGGSAWRHGDLLQFTATSR